MKKWKCPNCKREKETKDDVIMSMCKCGYELKEVKEKGVEK